MTSSELLDAVNQAIVSGGITPAQGVLITAVLTGHESFGADHAEQLGAIDWAKLLETVQKLLPVIVQLLPVIIALFAPKQPPQVEPNPNVTIGVR